MKRNGMKEHRDTICNQRHYVNRTMSEWSWEQLEAKSTHLCAWLDWTQNSHLYLCIAGILPGNIFWRKLFCRVTKARHILELPPNPNRKVFNYVVVDLESERSCDLSKGHSRIHPTMKDVGECPEEPHYTFKCGGGYRSWAADTIVSFPNDHRRLNDGLRERYKEQVERCPMVDMVKPISFKPTYNFRERNDIKVSQGEVQTFRMLNAASIVNKIQNQNQNENTAKEQLV